MTKPEKNKTKEMELLELFLLYQKAVFKDNKAQAKDNKGQTEDNKKQIKENKKQSKENLMTILNEMSIFELGDLLETVSNEEFKKIIFEEYANKLATNKYQRDQIIKMFNEPKSDREKLDKKQDSNKRLEKTRFSYISR